MSKVSQGRIIGIDVSRDWLDSHCLQEGKRARLPDKLDGHGQVAQRAMDLSALICFEATRGQEWRLWSALDSAGIATRQLPPAQSEQLMRHWFEHNGERLRCEPGDAGQDGSD